MADPRKTLDGGAPPPQDTGNPKGASGELSASVAGRVEKAVGGEAAEAREIPHAFRPAAAKLVFLRHDPYVRDELYRQYDALLRRRRGAAENARLAEMEKGLTTYEFFPEAGPENPDDEFSAERALRRELFRDPENAALVADFGPEQKRRVVVSARNLARRFFPGCAAVPAGAGSPGRVFDLSGAFPMSGLLRETPLADNDPLAVAQASAAVDFVRRELVAKDRIKTVAIVSGRTFAHGFDLKSGRRGQQDGSIPDLEAKFERQGYLAFDLDAAGNPMVDAGALTVDPGEADAAAETFGVESGPALDVQNAVRAKMLAARSGDLGAYAETLRGLLFGANERWALFAAVDAAEAGVDPSVLLDPLFVPHDSRLSGAVISKLLSHCSAASARIGQWKSAVICSFLGHPDAWEGGPENECAFWYELLVRQAAYRSGRSVLERSIDPSVRSMSPGAIIPRTLGLTAPSYALDSTAKREDQARVSRLLSEKMLSGEVTLSAAVGSRYPFFLAEHFGFGKSVFLACCAMETAKDATVLPVHINLPVDFAAKKTVAEFERSIRDKAAALAALSIRPVFLFDALDEIGDRTSREGVVAAIRGAFPRPKNPLEQRYGWVLADGPYPTAIIASRPGNPVPEAAESGNGLLWGKARLVPVSREEYVRARGLAPEGEQEFFRIATLPGIDRTMFSNNPLLLSLACRLAGAGKDLAAAGLRGAVGCRLGNGADFFESVLRLILLEHQSQSKVLESETRLPLARQPEDADDTINSLMGALAAFAYASVDGGGTSAQAQRAGLMGDYRNRVAVLFSVEQGKIAFVHRSFFEYFRCRFVVANFDKSAIARSVFDALKRQGSDRLKLFDWEFVSWSDFFRNALLLLSCDLGKGSAAGAFLDLALLDVQGGAVDGRLVILAAGATQIVRPDPERQRVLAEAVGRLDGSWFGGPEFVDALAHIAPDAPGTVAEAFYLAAARSVDTIYGGDLPRILDRGRGWSYREAAISDAPKTLWAPRLGHRAARADVVFKSLSILVLQNGDWVESVMRHLFALAPVYAGYPPFHSAFSEAFSGRSDYSEMLVALARVGLEGHLTYEEICAFLSFLGGEICRSSRPSAGGAKKLLSGLAAKRAVRYAADGYLQHEGRLLYWADAILG